MNNFQKQLVVGCKSLGELPDLAGKRYNNKITPPARVSVEEFEVTLQWIAMVRKEIRDNSIE